MPPGSVTGYSRVTGNPSDLNPAGTARSVERTAVFSIDDEPCGNPRTDQRTVEE